MDTIVIQRYVNKWPGILKFSWDFSGIVSKKDDNP